MTLGVYTMHDELFQPVADITLPVLRAYCERHGYPLTVCTERLSTKLISWDKLPLLLENLHRHDWSFYIDCDVLITNPELDLWRFLCGAEDADFVLSHDINGMNLGAYFVRNSVSARVVLSDAWQMRDRADIGSDQPAITEALKDSPAKVYWAPQKLFNAYPYSAEYGMPAETEGNWTPGDFAMHLPGKTVAERVEIFRKYLP